MPFLVDGHDSLRNGLGGMKADAMLSHPVEQIQKTVRTGLNELLGLSLSLDFVYSEHSTDAFAGLSI